MPRGGRAQMTRHCRWAAYEQNKRPGRMSGPSIGPAAGEEAAAQPNHAVLENFSTTTVTRAVIGAIACSVSLNDASVSLPDSATDFSSALRA
jgi:hypothetical protein